MGSLNAVKKSKKYYKLCINIGIKYFFSMFARRNFPNSSNRQFFFTMDAEIRSIVSPGSFFPNNSRALSIWVKSITYSVFLATSSIDPHSKINCRDLPQFILLQPRFSALRRPMAQVCCPYRIAYTSLLCPFLSFPLHGGVRGGRIKNYLSFLSTVS